MISASWSGGMLQGICNTASFWTRRVSVSGGTSKNREPNSGGSNLGPTSQKLKDAIKDRIDAYRKENGLSADQDVPADAVTASGSGLDPHISTRNAEFQVPRVAKARGLSEDKLRELIHQNTEGRDLGILGDLGVNVLDLNLALDSLASRPNE